MSPELDSSEFEALRPTAAPVFMSPRNDEDNYDDADDGGGFEDGDAKSDTNNPDSQFDDPEEAEPDEDDDADDEKDDDDLDDDEEDDDFDDLDDLDDDDDEDDEDDEDDDDEGPGKDGSDA